MHRVRAVAPAVEAVYNLFSAQSFQQSSICRQCALRLRSNRFQAATFTTSTRRRADGQEIKLATTWEGLPWVGGKDWAQEAASTEMQPFRTQERIQNAEDIHSHLLNAVVEVRLAQQTGEELNWSLGVQDSHWPRGVQVVPQNNGAFDIKFAKDTDREELLDLLVGTEVELAEAEQEQEQEDDASQQAAQNASSLDSQAAETFMEEQAEVFTREDLDGIVNEQIDSLPTVYATTNGKGWMNISLKDPNFRFLLLKRLQQRLGNPVPDNRIHTLTTLGQLADLLCIKEKPKRLHEAIKDDVRVLANSNVQMHERRVTPIDKEKALGRWKVIERELSARGLPVTGNDY